MNSSNARVLIGILALAGVAGALGIHFSGGAETAKPDHDDRSEVMRTEDNSVAATDALPGGSVASISKRGGTPSLPVATPHPAVEAVPEGARSFEDGTWLRKHLYPTADDLKSAMSELPAHGVPSTASEVAAAERMLIDDSTRGSAEHGLLAAAENGSVYALVALGTYYEPTNPVLAQSYFRAAIMRGDWMVALRVKPAFDTLTDAQASLLAIRLLETLDQRRARRGLPPLGRSVRPGVEDFIAILEVLREEQGGEFPETPPTE